MRCVRLPTVLLCVHPRRRPLSVQIVLGSYGECHPSTNQPIDQPTKQLDYYWCGTVRYGTVWCGVVRCGTVRYRTVRYEPTNRWFVSQQQIVNTKDAPRTVRYDVYSKKCECSRCSVNKRYGLGSVSMDNFCEATVRVSSSTVVLIRK